MSANPETRRTLLPPKNSTLIFRETSPRRVWSGSKLTYYIKASVNGASEQKIRIASQQQQDVIDYLLKTDLKLTGATVQVDTLGRFTILKHSDSVKDK